MGIRTVIDIGANKGKAAEEFHRFFPDAEIFSFEPLPDCFALMQERMKDVPRFHAFNVALGEVPGSVTMHRSSYSGSSSLRAMAELHKRLFPITAGERLLQVSVDTLDRILASHTLEPDILVKIDVQGFEDQVIRGGRGVFGRARIAIIETSFCPLYEGQPLFGGIYRLMDELGFVYAGAWDPDFRSPEDGTSIQQDSIFLRA